jgi:hypothetical protein
MDDVKAYIVATVRYDPTLITLMGITATDWRIYPSYNPDTIISNAQQGFITYRVLTAGEAGGRIYQPVLRLQIWGKTWQRTEDIRDQLLVIFNKLKHTTAAPASRIIWMKHVYEADVAPEATSSTNYPGKAVDFRVGYEDGGIN